MYMYIDKHWFTKNEMSKRDDILLNIRVQSVKKKEKKNQKTLIYFSTNFRTEMKLVPIIMDYFLLQFGSLKFFFGIRLHGEVFT